jgi:hypothetical protein
MPTSLSAGSIQRDREVSIIGSVRMTGKPEFDCCDQAVTLLTLL